MTSRWSELTGDHTSDSGPGLDLSHWGRYHEDIPVSAVSASPRIPFDLPSEGVHLGITKNWTSEGLNGDVEYHHIRCGGAYTAWHQPHTLGSASTYLLSKPMVVKEVGFEALHVSMCHTTTIRTPVFICFCGVAFFNVPYHNHTTLAGPGF